MEPLSGVRDPETARHVLRTAFPRLPLGRLRLLGAGWDTTVFLVDEVIAFRLPQHPAADRALGTEIALLARTTGRLPVPVPDYRCVAAPTVAFRWRIGGYPMLAGSPLDPALARDAEHLAEQIAAFLAALHMTPEALLPPGVPRFSPASWLEHHDRLVAGALPLIEGNAADLALRLSAWWDAYRSDPRATTFAPVLVHGDLATEHLLLDRQGNLAGVIDFGDAMQADPALDLAGLPGPLRKRVLAHYDVDPVARDTLGFRAAAYRRLAPLHSIDAAGRLGRPELLPTGLRELTGRLANA